jgi:hypothetical protein
MEQFPPNSHKARAGYESGPKRVERVTSEDVRRRKPSLGKLIRQTLFTGDTARIAVENTITETVIPEIREMILEASNSMLERVITGRHRGNRRSPAANPLGHVAYNTQYQRGPAPRTQPQQLSRPSRMRHAFDEIVISSRQEAEEVLDRMYDLLSRDEVVTVADLYELTGIVSSHTDKKWGWEDLRGSSVGRVRGGGYLLELPEPIPL